MTNTGCCKDEKKQIKLTLDQQKTVEGKIAIPSSIAVAKPAAILIEVKIASLKKHNLAYLHGPPILLNKNTQAFMATFLI